jgi:dihydropteroate synthase
MKEHNLRFIQIKTLADARREIQNIGSDLQSIDIMAPKAVMKVVKLEQVRMQDALIIKQDMLSLGGEVAIPKDAFELQQKPAAILIMGTVKQLGELVVKLSRHYPRLQRIAQELSDVLKTI